MSGRRYRLRTGCASIDALGPVRYLVSPNALHHLFLAEWKAAYPAARLYASPRLRRKRKDLAFEATLAEAPEPEWAADIDQVVVVVGVAIYLKSSLFNNRLAAKFYFKFPGFLVCSTQRCYGSRSTETNTIKSVKTKNKLDIF